MTDFARRTTALVFTTLTSALLLIAAVGPAHTGTPVAQTTAVMA